MENQVKSTLNKHHVVAYVIAAVAVAVALTAAVLANSASSPKTSAGSVLSKGAQERVAEIAATAKVPDCAPKVPATMGACAPKQALALAQALAPEGNTLDAGQPETAPGVISTVTNLFTGIAQAASANTPHGPDTSHYNFCSTNVRPVINGGAKFWIISVGDGNYVDPCYKIVYSALRSSGIPHTTYLFTRQYLNPITSADHYAALIRAVGGVDSLPPVNDAETITSCSWNNTFDNRLKADLNLTWIFDYASPGTWAGCGANGNREWGAAYGPVAPVLHGFPTWAFWQYTDGAVGPLPHSIGGLRSDISIFNGDQAKLNALVAHPVAPKPIPNKAPYDFYARCSNLDAITYWKHHGGHGHVSHAQHDQAVRIRQWLAKNQIGCTAPGWLLKPRTKAASKPYRYPLRKGALA